MIDHFLGEFPHVCSNDPSEIHNGGHLPRMFSLSDAKRRVEMLDSSARVRLKTQAGTNFRPLLAKHERTTSRTNQIHLIAIPALCQANTALPRTFRSAGDEQGHLQGLDGHRHPAVRPQRDHQCELRHPERGAGSHTLRCGETRPSGAGAQRTVSVRRQGARSTGRGLQTVRLENYQTHLQTGALGEHRHHGQGVCEEMSFFNTEV